MCFFLQAIDSIHNVGVFCLALVPANTLPKTPLGGIHLSETKQLFLEGSLHPCNVLMCPHTCVTNLPKPRQKQPGLSAARSPQMSYEIRSARNCVCVLSSACLWCASSAWSCRDWTRLCDGGKPGLREEDRSGQWQRSGPDRRQWSGKKGVCVVPWGLDFHLSLHSFSLPFHSFLTSSKPSSPIQPRICTEIYWHIFVFNSSVAIH